ncbi:MAG: hypothetical protein ACOX52_16965 [Verrucomicrobiota bacterium]|jgi:hypothetical protein
MKTTKLLLYPWLLGVLLAASPAVAETNGAPEAGPQTGWANVSLPITSWEKLWRTAERNLETERADPTPPVATVLLGSDLELALDATTPQLKAVFRVESLEESWQVTPLIGGDLRLIELQAEPQHTLIWQDNKYCLLSQGTGGREVTLTFALPPISTWTAENGVCLAPAAGTFQRLRVSGIPENHKLVIPGISPTTQTPTSALFHLPSVAEGGQFQLSLERDLPVPPPVASQWDLDSEWIVQYKDGRIHYLGRIYAQADGGSGLSMTLTLPGEAQEIAYESDDLAYADLERTADGARTLNLQWQTRDILDRRLQITYQIPQSPLAAQWSLKAPGTGEPTQTRGLFVIPTIDGLRLSSPDLLDSTQSRRLPEWMQAHVANAAYVSIEAAQTCTLQAVWLPRLPTAQAVIDLAEYQTRLVQDGSLLVSAQFAIRHQQPIAWRIQLPQIDQMLACTVNDTPIQPVLAENGEIEFSLHAPASGISRVGFSYTAQTEPLDPVSGRIALTLPNTPLFIDRLEWALSIPDDYETTALEGSVAIDRSGGPSAPPAGADSQAIRMFDELVRGELPTVELYYQKRGLQDAR